MSVPIERGMGNDKLIIISMVLLFTGLIIFGTGMGYNNLVDFGIDMTKAFSASLLTLVASRHFGERKADANTDQFQSTPTPTRR